MRILAAILEKDSIQGILGHCGCPPADLRLHQPIRATRLPV
jgi:hypothetical protein